VCSLLYCLYRVHVQKFAKAAVRIIMKVVRGKLIPRRLSSQTWRFSIILKKYQKFKQQFDMSIESGGIQSATLSGSISEIVGS